MLRYFAVAMYQAVQGSKKQYLGLVDLNVPANEMTLQLKNLRVVNGRFWRQITFDFYHVLVQVNAGSGWSRILINPLDESWTCLRFIGDVVLADIHSMGVPVYFFYVFQTSLWARLISFTVDLIIFIYFYKMTVIHYAEKSIKCMWSKYDEN